MKDNIPALMCALQRVQEIVRVEKASIKNSTTLRNLTWQTIPDRQETTPAYFNTLAWKMTYSQPMKIPILIFA